MKNTLLFITFLTLLSFQSFGQNHNYLSFELAGSGGVGSLNFEHAFYKKEKLELDYRIGFSAAPIDKNNGVALIFPLMVHGIYGSTAHKLDVGIGVAFTVTTRLSLFMKSPVSIGYRFEPVDKNYYLRLAYTPIVGYLVDFNWQHWGGFTYGYKFTKK